MGGRPAARPPSFRAASPLTLMPSAAVPPPAPPTPPSISVSARSTFGRLKLLLAGFVAGGRSALAAVAAARYDVLRGAPKATKLALLREVGSTLRREG